MIFSKKTEKLFVLTCLTAIVSIFFFFGFQHLTQFVTADEHYWLYERIPQYWQAFSDGKLKKTMINDKPGITVALVSGAGLFSEKNPGQFGAIDDSDLAKRDAAHFEPLLSAFRLPILIFNGLFLFFFFWIIGKIANHWIALWSTAFIGLSPILIGISQIVNPDSLLWPFSAAAIFSYFALLKHHQKKYLILTALFTGLAILSKYTANILFPFYFFSLVTYLMIEKGEVDRPEMTRYFKTQLFYFWLLVGGALLTVSFFLPAVFVKPDYLYRLTLGFSTMPLIFGMLLALTLIFYLDLRFFGNRIRSAARTLFFKNNYWIDGLLLSILSLFLALIVGRNLVPEWKMFALLPFDLKDLSYADNFGYYPNLLEKYLLEMNPLIFSLTPPVILLAFFAWLKPVLSRKKEEYLFFVFALTFFIFIYFTGSIASGVMAIIRYSILLYPLFGFLAALGLWSIYDAWLKNIRGKVLPALTLLVMLLSCLSLSAIKPFYFNYTNFLLPKDKLVSDAWGYGGYEAAQYLNALPDAENINVWADYSGVCEFFKGKCATRQYRSSDDRKFDYAVITRRGRALYNPDHIRWQNEKNLDMTSAYKNPDTRWSMEIDGRPENFIKVVKIEN